MQREVFVIKKSELRKEIRELLSERIKIKDVTKNPKGSAHDVTVYAEISPTDPSQLTSTGYSNFQQSRAIARGEHDSLKKDVVLQGDYIEDANGVNTLRLKFYDSSAGPEYQRKKGITPRQQLLNLRSENPDEFVPYDEGGEFYDALKPTPSHTEVPKRKKRKKEATTGTSTNSQSSATPAGTALAQTLRTEAAALLTEVAQYGILNSNARIKDESFEIIRILIKGTLTPQDLASIQQKLSLLAMRLRREQETDLYNRCSALLTKILQINKKQ